MRLLPLLALAATLTPAEIIDRVCVTVDRQVITLSALEERLRVAAFLNSDKVDLSPANRRRMAERIIEQALVQREMEISRYTMPGDQEVAEYLGRIRKTLALSAADFAKRMKQYRLTEEALRENLRVQLATIRFIDLRFRPGSAVSQGDIQLYYRETFVPEWQQANPGKTAPEVDDVEDEIEQTLLARQANEQLSGWLKQARTSARVVFFEEAFQ
ncbi:MAG: hypothetical protein JNN08_18460 [Bryobacterales bacterium]|nr:hypothetical protein [Bryobacterales bacterium]